MRAKSAEEKPCVLITMKKTNNAAFSIRIRKGIKRKIIAYPTITGSDVQIIQTEVWTKNLQSDYVQTLSYDMHKLLVIKVI